MRKNSLYILCALFLVSCSMTKNIPDDDQLFTGLKAITYSDYEKNDNFTQTQEEVEAALATAPNGAIFGSQWCHFRQQLLPLAVLVARLCMEQIS